MATITTAIAATAAAAITVATVVTTTRVAATISGSYGPVIDGHTVGLYSLAADKDFGGVSDAVPIIPIAMRATS